MSDETQDTGINEAPTVDEQEEREERRLEQEALLVDLPALREPHRLRVRHTNRLLRIIAEIQPFMKDEDGDEDSDESVDFNDPRVKATLDMTEKIDEFAESIAVDPDAYIAWSEGKKPRHFMALLNRYSEALGK